MKLIREIFDLGGSEEEGGVAGAAKQGFRGRFVGKLAALLRAEMKIPNFSHSIRFTTLPQELKGPLET